MLNKFLLLAGMSYYYIYEILAYPKLGLLHSCFRWLNYKWIYSSFHLPLWMCLHWPLVIRFYTLFCRFNTTVFLSRKSYLVPVCTVSNILIVWVWPQNWLEDFLTQSWLNLALTGLDLDVFSIHLRLDSELILATLGLWPFLDPNNGSLNYSTTQSKSIKHLQKPSLWQLILSKISPFLGLYININIAFKEKLYFIKSLLWHNIIWIPSDCGD